MLKIIDITKAYAIEKDSVLALKGVTIEFRRNEFVSILGPSGCGKTTLLNIIGGLDRYTSGDIQIEGVSTKEYDDVDWDTYRNRRIGFVFQSYNLIPHMNILKNVALSLTLAGVEKEERYRRAQEALEKVGLGSESKKKPNQLSGGQMQRVAIARALVNNPEIILADEPTGALDSESGIQVMDLLKEVANDRLVIMVTHNPNLAEEYSTRIVYLKDGQVDGDTMPYDSTVEPEGALPVAGDVSTAEDNEQVEEPRQDVNAEVLEDEEGGNEPSVKPEKKKSKFRNLFRKRRAQGKTSMKLRTAISLSWNNLLSKKGRTIITSVAGSIGIIGIILVLSLSTGAKAYVSSLEESALSNYPITISRSRADISLIMSMLMEEDGEDREKNPDSTTIYIKKFLGKVLSPEMVSMIAGKNDLKKFKAYIDKNFNNDLATVKYNYGINFNAFIQDPSVEDRYMKVNPYTEVMQSVIDNMPSDWLDMDFGGMTLNDMIGQATSNTGMSSVASMFMSTGNLMNAWDEMSSNQKLLEMQYELVGDDSKWPSAADEIVVVLDNRNQLVDFQLFMLGLKSQDDVINALEKKSTFADDTVYDVSDILSLRYKVLTEIDYFEEDLDEEGNGLGTWTQHVHGEQNKDAIDRIIAYNQVNYGIEPLELKVVGVVRPKPGVESTSIQGVYGYTPALTQLLIERAKQHPAMKEMLKRVREDDAKGDYSTGRIVSPITFTNGFYMKVNGSTSDIGYIKTNEESDKKVLSAGDTILWYDTATQGYNADYLTMLRNLGVAEREDPLSIEFYCTTFEAKDKIVEFINQYNEETDEDIKYSDLLATMMSFVNTMANTITGVLVAFAAISLVVSTIMIAIIIYTSVLERRKEIGVLRSIGARKKDISRVFIAESAILGAYSGLIGLLVSYLISLLGRFVLKMVFEIDGLMDVKWWHCVMMLGISILLSMIAGFIPSRIAAKKDPAIALRSE
ncbi:MAG: ABC transporter ATP-binding protein/permease [Clostridia bacterium]|nr:ABC transporter ATP-binding protein/permease [Clostridia bacterium]